MLQRLLSEFLKVDGVVQAMMMDDRGALLSSVGMEGRRHQFSKPSTSRLLPWMPFSTTTKAICTSFEIEP